MNKTQSKIWFLIAVLFAVCVTILTLSHIVTEPWHIAPDLAGDGAKNLFTYAYHSIYGKGYWFEGMNYPYGEHIVYTDGQPILAILLSSLHVNINTALSVLWLLIGFSYVLSIIYNYKILIHFKVAPLAAIVFSGLICTLSPQIFRIEGHYALSYMCVIPMLFYWTIQYHELRAWKYSLYIFISGIIYTFLHPYFSAVVFIWILSYAAGFFIFTKGQVKNKLKHLWPILLSMLLVFVVITSIMAITDPLKDRPVMPHGILSYTTHLNDIFTSIHSPIWQYADEHHMLRDIFPHVSTGGEGVTYIGVIATFVLIFSFFTAVIYKIRKKPGGTIINREGFSPVWMFMALVLLIFAMGIPFIWNMEWLLDYVSILRQFRTLGRFSWVFYYIITIYSVVAIYSFYTWTVAKRKAYWGYAILILAISIWSYDASGYVQLTRETAQDAPHNYDDFFSTKSQSWESFLAQNHYSKKDFQAILILDFFHIGSEKLWVGNIGPSTTLGMEASLQLHLPMVDVMMSRTSLSQTEKQVKIAGGPYVWKPILSDIKSNKPFLLIKLSRDSLPPNEKYLLLAANKIGSFSSCDLYAFYPDRQRANDKKNADSINKILPFVRAGTDTCIETKGDWYVNHLDKTQAAEQLFGTGAEAHISTSDSIIATVPLKPLTDNQQYEFSAWFLLSDKDYTSPCVYLQSLDSAGNQIDEAGMNTKWSVDNHGLWFRGSAYFRVKANCRAMRFKLVNEPIPSYKIMDEIQLRPADALIISKAADGSVMVNNHLFNTNK